MSALRRSHPLASACPKRLLGLLYMRLEQFHRLIRLSGAAVFQEQLVLSLRTLFSGSQRHLHADEPIHMSEIRFYHLKQPWTVARFIQGEVEAPVYRSPVLGVGVGVVGFQNTRGMCQVFLRHVGDREAQRVALKGDPDVQHLEDVLERKARNDSPSVGFNPDQALRLELAQRFAHGDATGTVLLGQLILAQLRSLAQFTPKDRRA